MFTETDISNILRQHGVENKNNTLAKALFDILELSKNGESDSQF
ncbi:hypothetical protein [Liquorilactobacillus capillatus]|nr:hypothetical protein [Liquorilactobacillus capillatus]